MASVSLKTKTKQNNSNKKILYPKKQTKKFYQCINRFANTAFFIHQNNIFCYLKYYEHIKLNI